MRRQLAIAAVLILVGALLSQGSCYAWNQTDLAQDLVFLRFARQQYVRQQQQQQQAGARRGGPPPAASTPVTPPADAPSPSPPVTPVK